MSKQVTFTAENIDGIVFKHIHENEPQYTAYTIKVLDGESVDVRWTEKDQPTNTHYTLAYTLELLNRGIWVKQD